MSRKSRHRMMTGRARAHLAETVPGPALAPGQPRPAQRVVMWCGHAATCVNGPDAHQWHVTCQERP